MNTKQQIMSEQLENPLKNLTKEELSNFVIAIDKKFEISSFRGVVIEDYETRWCDLMTECIDYVLLNKATITKDYHGKEILSFSDMVKMIINKQMAE